MPRQIKPASNEPAIKVVMMPRDTNADGTIFGGVLLSLIDQAAYVEAMRQYHARYVTVAFREVEFHEPVYVGDLLALYGDAVRIGNTSITIDVRVCAQRRKDADSLVKVTEAEVVFVSIGPDGKPSPIPEL